MGLLNLLMKSKGLIEPDTGRQLCGETVPLLLFEKYTWATTETFASALPALQDHPEARQLMRSLLRYVASPAFAPKAASDAGLLQKLMPGEIP